MTKYLRQVSKRKLMKFINEYRLDDDYYGSIIITSELINAIEDGSLDMAKDYRIHGEEALNE
jgi:hypothetical protein